MTNRRTWPKRWVSQPVSGIDTALAAAKIVITQVPSSTETPSSPEMVGIATFAIDESSTFMNIASDTATVPSASLAPVRGRGTVEESMAMIRWKARAPPQARGAVAGRDTWAARAGPPAAFCSMMRAISASASSPYLANTSVW